MPNSPWYVTWLLRFTLGNSTTRRGAAQEYLQAEPETRDQLARAWEPVVGANFTLASPCDSDFPLLATVEALRQNGLLNTNLYFAWMRLHASCVSFFFEELIIALWHRLQAHDPKLAATFVDYVQHNETYTQRFNKYLLAQRDRALDYITTGVRVIQPDVEPSIFVDWRTAVQMLRNIDLHEQSSPDDVLELLELIPPRPKQLYAHDHLPDFIELLDSEYRLPGLDPELLSIHNGSVRQAKRFAMSIHRSIISDIMFTLFPHVSLADRLILAEKVIISRVEDILDHETLSSDNEMSNLVPYAATYIQDQHAHGKFSMHTLQLTDDLLAYFKEYEAINYFSIAPGWADAFAILNLHLLQYLEILNITNDTMQKYPLHPGGLRTFFVAWNKLAEMGSSMPADQLPAPNLTGTYQANLVLLVDFARHLLPSEDAVDCSANSTQAICNAPIVDAARIETRRQLIAVDSGPGQYIRLLAAAVVLYALAFACCLVCCSMVDKPPRRNTRARLR